MYINIEQLVAKLRSADEDSSVVSPVGSMLRFPGGGLLHVVREVQELPQEPCFCLSSESSGGKNPSLSPSLGGSCCFFSFRCLPRSKGESSFPSPRLLSPQRCCPAGLTLLRSVLSWLQALLGVCCCHTSPAAGAKPRAACTLRT